MSTLALILGREGSKGAPGKNWRPIADRPCVAWTIDAAQEARASGAVSRIAISTDSAELQRIGFEAGIDVIGRPAELASDTAAIDDAARHALLALADSSIERIVILYANVPVRPPDLITRCVRLLIDTGADSVQSYEPVGKRHPWWTAVVADPAEGGGVRPWEGSVLNHGVYRRQDLPPAHVPDGGALVVTRRALMLENPGVPPGPHAFFGADRRGIINPPGAVIDIDDERDALVADAILRERIRATLPEGLP